MVTELEQTGVDLHVPLRPSSQSSTRKALSTRQRLATHTSKVSSRQSPPNNWAQCIDGDLAVFQMTCGLECSSSC